MPLFSWPEIKVLWKKIWTSSSVFSNGAVNDIVARFRARDQTEFFGRHRASPAGAGSAAPGVARRSHRLDGKVGMGRLTGRPPVDRSASPAAARVSGVAAVVNEPARRRL